MMGDRRVVWSQFEHLTNTHIHTTKKDVIIDLIVCENESGGEAKRAAPIEEGRAIIRSYNRF